MDTDQRRPMTPIKIVQILKHNSPSYTYVNIVFAPSATVSTTSGIDDPKVTTCLLSLHNSQQLDRPIAAYL